MLQDCKAGVRRVIKTLSSETEGRVHKKHESTIECGKFSMIVRQDESTAQPN